MKFQKRRRNAPIKQFGAKAVKTWAMQDEKIRELTPWRGSDRKERLPGIP